MFLSAFVHGLTGFWVAIYSNALVCFWVRPKGPLLGAMTKARAV